MKINAISVNLKLALLHFMPKWMLIHFIFFSLSKKESQKLSSSSCLCWMHFYSRRSEQARGKERRTEFMFKSHKKHGLSEFNRLSGVQRRRRRWQRKKIKFQVFCLWSKESKIYFRRDWMIFPARNVISFKELEIFFSLQCSTFHDKTQFFLHVFLCLVFMIMNFRFPNRFRSCFANA